MATPTSHPNPQIAQKQPAASHLTPASGGSPPAPSSSHSRSVTSPAYSTLKATARQLHHLNGSAQIPGSTPRAGPGTPRPGTTSSADSPAATAAAAMLMDPQYGFANGAGLGLGFTPRGTGFTPVAMQLTGSSGGINSIIAAQDHEEERKRRMEAIAAMVAGRWGFVSQEGVERCAKRLGLDALWEDGMREGKRMLTIAGTAMLLEVEFEAEEVIDCVLSFPGSGEDVGGRAARGAEVLRRHLKGEGYLRLEGFVENMEILGRMDRLGGEKISCFDATDGVFRSLEKLWRWEVEREKQQGKEVVEEEVICRRSGRPRMHTRGRVGLALQYWMERMLLLGEEKKADEMDTDDKGTGDVDGETDIWSAIIECEASSAELYPSIRVSDAWVSRAVEKPAPAESNDIPGKDTTIDWQDPSPTLLPPDEQGERAATVTGSNVLQQFKQPDVRFVAKFEPPVVVPLQTALQIHNSVGSAIPQEMILSTTYESLLFAEIDVQNPSNGPRTVEKTVTSYDSATDTSTSHVHKYSLFAQQQDWARAITHLPFSHPRQIIAVLPILRQWALTGSILRRAFVTNPNEEPTSPTANSHSTSQDQLSEPTTFQTLDAELAAFMSSPLPNAPKPPSDKLREAQITFKATPVPQFQVNFPNPRYGGKLAGLNFMIGLNGIISCVDVHDGSPDWGSNGAANAEADEKGRERVRMREKARKVLEVGENIGVAVEWMTR
ncbi:MAG: hypothetical protein ALECFALPRED_000532 [Alectoria fallacina]|uniref:Mediator of RNA polymerase II transcription subunit 1 n=1 Tax=Alectoria fallacina TaxID=1903189 RepID=A0A8H3PKQ0_9LECA|nr:MAG: hypothetical protein ALECFALPRED_000532 [Alectoria fallacina]